MQEESKAGKDKNQDQPAVSLDNATEDKPTVTGHVPNLPSPKGPGSGNKPMVLTGLLILIALVAISSYFAFRTNPKTVTTKSATSATAAKPAPAAISISNTGFTPASISTKVGQAVVWTNSDTAPHLIASTNPTPVFSSQQALAQDDSYSYVFNKAGTYPYRDTSNPTLKGVVIVK